jgi:hypothetical protein
MIGVNAAFVKTAIDRQSGHFDRLAESDAKV